MKPCSFEDPVWHQAATLLERAAALDGSHCLVPADEALAARWLTKWRSTPPFPTDSWFTQRLAVDNLNEPEFRCLLGDSAVKVKDRFRSKPAWLNVVEEAYASVTAVETPAAPSANDLGFVTVAGPLLRAGGQRLTEAALRLAVMKVDLPFDPASVAELLMGELYQRLSPMVSRTMVLELNVARLRGELRGKLPQERFASFLERLADPAGALAILSEYPVLARQLVRCVDQWVRCNVEFLQHLAADWPALCERFHQSKDPGQLVAVESGAGDRHCGGHSVIIVRFSSGLVLVYKPRPMALDVHFQELLEWLNDRGAQPAFRPLRLLDVGTHGWSEFVTAKGCASEAEVRRFYERQGGCVALLYALHATDFHSDNLIAAGEHPVLIDLEALFHPSFRLPEHSQAENFAADVLGHSVCATGLLPFRMWANEDSAGVDISGLGARDGQLTPFAVPHWEASGTDEMHLTRSRLPMRASQNRPTLAGVEVDPLDFAETLASGFAQTYEMLLAHRQDLLSQTGLLARFAKDRMRVIARPTGTYAALLRESFHPDVLRDALDRELLFDRLWIPVDALPHLAKLIPHERADLLNGDIPILTTTPASRNLTSSSGKTIPNFFEETGLEQARKRIAAFNPDDLSRQLWFIRASLATLPTELAKVRTTSRPPLAPTGSASRESLLDAARAVAERLTTLAVRGEHDATWLGMVCSPQGHWSISPLGLDLYDGLPGVILFLAQLRELTGDAQHTDLAQRALKSLQALSKSYASSFKLTGAFSGWGGVVWALTHLGAQWQRDDLLAEASAIVERLPQLIQEDNELDVISGSAGCLLSLLSLRRIHPSDRTLAAAIQCGDRLLATAQRMPTGIAWKPSFAACQPLTGFSHGVAGMASALLELGAVTGDDRYRKAALDAIAYERSVFDPTEENWPDFREANSDGSHAYAAAWCHGAPGIGLARLSSVHRYNDSAVRAEIFSAVRTTLARGFGGNHCLCHGDLGNIELLLQVKRAFGGTEWDVPIGRLAASILSGIKRDGWQCGVPLAVESPGLMTGLAGIGYGLLRLAEPERVPSVLMLEPPRMSTKQNDPQT